ncbi:alpha/beta-hydrolase family protein [Streptomyces sp. ODS28]|uniref:alpha/beta hydrolase n=1 Tax=Streptomyces sp. ODS28 TaxID=3136688 RepID=UPI0031EB6D5D
MVATGDVAGEKERARALARRLGQRLRPAVTAFARRPYRDRSDPSRLVRRWPDLIAICAATLFFWLSLTPSLVPRPWYLQGVIGGITAAMGYAVGALLLWGLRPAAKRLFSWRPGERWRARAWLAYYVLAFGLTAYWLSQSAHLQRKLRALQHLPPTLTWHSLMIALIAVLLFTALLLLARSVRLGTRALVRGLCRIVPRPVAVVLGIAVSATVVVFGTRDVVFERGVIDVVSRIAASTDQDTKDGIHRPRSPLVAGGPGSLLKWGQLGYEGRNFTGSALPARQIRAVTGRPAKEPVRVYVGRRSASGYAAGARLAVRELERTGAFDRKVLAIAGTTGMGWVNSTDAEPLEYLYGGDTAIVAMQYSYLPSWASFLVDKEQAGRANRALVKAVRERWLQEPPKERPKLVVFGESLGAYGIEASFHGVDDLLSKVDGAVLVGSPEFSPVRSEITARRDEGSPVWRPEFESGQNIRFAQYPERDLRRPSGVWGKPRVVYLQNASDAIAWWTPDLAFSRPEWTKEPLGPDVTTEVDWFPLVTFWQTTVDMAVAYGVDAPHGHRYGTGSVRAWASVLPPKGWTGTDTARLQHYMDRREAPY